MKLNNYIPRGSEASWQALSDFSDAKLYGFVVKARAASVHDLLTRYIKRPSQRLGLNIDVRGTTFDRVLFMFLDSERSQRPSNKSDGVARQAERLFAIVVLGRRVEPTQGFVLFAPYVFATETPAWRVEREIYGYPQQHGRVKIDDDDGNGPARLSVESLVINKFAADANTKPRRFLRIERMDRTVSAAAAHRHLPVKSLGKRLKDITGVANIKALDDDPVPIVRRSGRRSTAADEAFFARGPLLQRVEPESALEKAHAPVFDLAEVLSKSHPMLFLKQFRDIVQPTRACYQAIVEAQLKVDGKIKAIYLDQYALTLDDADSVPIRRELGIPSNPVPVECAFRIDMKKMTIDKASVISNPYWNPAVEVSLADETSRLPAYVDRGGEAVWRHPSRLWRARIYGFGVPVSEERQRECLDRCINRVANASNTRYGSPSANKFELGVVPGLGTVMLMFVDYRRITSGNDDDALLGGTRYREFLVMQLAPSSTQDPPELNWFIPFIYLDTDSPRLAGREIFGYPKQFGTIAPFKRYTDGGTDLDPVKTLKLSAVVVKGASQQNADEGVVIRIDGRDNRPPTILRHYADAESMIRDQLKHLQHGAAQQLLQCLGQRQRAAAGFDNALAFSNVGNVFLKQFRDCADPKIACYQAVCKTDTVPGRFHGGGAVDPSHYTIRIPRLASEPLLSYIGRGDARALEEQITPAFAYWAELDVELTNGRVIANPYEIDYVPDVSCTRTAKMEPLGKTAPPRAVRRSGQAELLEPVLTRREEKD